MEEQEQKRRGRVAGQVKDVGYIKIDNDIRVRIEEDCLTIQERTSSDNSEDECWNGNHYLTSWASVLNWLIRHYTTQKISKKQEWTFLEAKKEIIATTKEVADMLIGDLDKANKSAEGKVKEYLDKWNSR